MAMLTSDRRPILRTLLLLAAGALLLLSACKSNTAAIRQTKAITTRYNIYFNGYEAWKAGMQSMERSHDEDYSRRLQLHPVYQYATKTPRQDANFERAIDKCKIAVQRRSITQKPKRKQNASPQYKEFMQRGEYNPFMHRVWLLSGRAQFYEGDFDAAMATYTYVARHFSWRPLALAECHIMTARAHVIQGDVYQAESELGLLIPHSQYQSLDDLMRLEAYRNLTRRLQREFCLCEAEILLARPQTQMQAIPYLNTAMRGFVTKEQRLRTQFLIAQLCEQDGRQREAYRRYGKIISRAKDYKTQFNARIAQTRVMPQGRADATHLSKAERRLGRMRWQSRNAEYLDQIHYALGNMALGRGDTTRAIDQYERAIERSTRGGNDKAVAALALGRLTFDRADYVKAQKAYATVMGIIKEDEWDDYKDIQRLSQVLDALQTHAETVELQDSLLWLSTLGEDELNKVVDNLIKELRRKEKAEAEAQALAAYEERKATQVDPLAQAITQPTVGPQDKSWYFYNPSQIAAGKAEFQRRWGARKPEDNWRRKNKTETLTWPTDDDALTDGAQAGADSLAAQADDALAAAGMSAGGADDAQSAGAAGGATSAATAGGRQPGAPGSPTLVGGADSTALDQTTLPDALGPDSATLALAADPHNREYYLVQIPRTDEQRDQCDLLIEEALYNMGVIINEQLENFPLAIETFGRMERRYPESTRLPDAWYASYLMSMRMASSPTLIARFGHDSLYYADQAQLYRQKLISGFPESAYGVAVSDPDYIETLRQMAEGQDSLYIATYGAYLRSATDSVHQSYYFVHDHWPLSALMPKFLFLHALSYVREGDKQAFREALEQLTATYPESDVAPLAGFIVKGIHEGRDVQLGGDVHRGMLWGASLRRDTDEGNAPDPTMTFTTGDDQPYLLLLAYQKDSLTYDQELPAGIRAENNLLFEVAKFNFENYLIKDFDLEIIETSGGLSVLVISGFNDLDQLYDYHDRMATSASLALPDGITMIDISEANFRVLLSGRTFDEYFDWLDQTYGADEPDDDTPPADEAADDAPADADRPEPAEIGQEVSTDKPQPAEMDQQPGTDGPQPDETDQETGSDGLEPAEIGQ